MSENEKVGMDNKRGRHNKMKGYSEEVIMKIGEFAKRYGVKKSTVRYYVDEGLLVPKRGEGYPDFTGECHREMEQILRYRDMGVSLTDISDILLKRRLNQRITIEQKGEIEHMLKRRREELNDEFIQIEKKIRNIDSYIENLCSEQVEREECEGVPLEFLEDFRCPRCREGYNISGATLREGAVIEGGFQCSCGEHFKIGKGGVVQVIQRDSQCEDESMRNLMEVYAIEKNKTLKYQIKNEYYRRLRDAGVRMDEVMDGWNHQDGILFINGDKEVLILGLLENFKEDGVYFFASKSKSSLDEMRSLIIERDIYKRCVFIHYTDEIPIRGGAAYFVDIGGYIEDILRYRKRWTIEQIRGTLGEMREGIYLDYGYYPTHEDYFESYRGMGLKERIIHIADVQAGEVLMNHSNEKMVKIRTYHLKSTR